MGEKSNIEWTDATFNGVRGCTKYSPGCDNCYAETAAGINPGTLGVWGPAGNRVAGAEAYWNGPKKWNREAAAAGTRKKVFAFSFADWLEEWAGPIIDTGGRRLALTLDGRWLPAVPSPTPELPADAVRWLNYDDARARLFGLIHETPHLDWLLLTKRADRLMPWVPHFYNLMHALDLAAGKLPTADQTIPANVHLGVTTENQQTADERVPLLMRCPARLRWLSVEPMLGPIYLGADGRGCRALPITRNADGGYERLDFADDPNDRFVDWVVVGGESGAGARPCAVEWVRDIVRQCRAAGVAVFVKQLGSAPTDGMELTSDAPDAPTYYKPLPLILADKKKGKDVAEWPADLAVREFPGPLSTLGW